MRLHRPALHHRLQLDRLGHRPRADGLAGLHAAASQPAARACCATTACWRSQIDDNEFARLYLLLAELFEERNLKVVCVKMAEPTGLKMASVLKYGGLPKLKEYIILAGKSGVRGLHIERVRKGGWDREYNLLVSQVSYGDVRRLKALIAKPDRSPADLKRADAICARFRFEPVDSAYRREAPSRTGREDWRYRNAWRIVRSCATSPTAKRLADARRSSLDAACGAFTVETPQRKLYLIKADYNPASAQPRMRLLFADDYLSVHPGDFWSDIKTTGLGDEGGVDFLNGKKTRSPAQAHHRHGDQPGRLGARRLWRLGHDRGGGA